MKDYTLFDSATMVLHPFTQVLSGSVWVLYYGDDRIGVRSLEWGQDHAIERLEDWCRFNRHGHLARAYDAFKEAIEIKSSI